MPITEFDLLKKSAITTIQTDLENAVSADRIAAENAETGAVTAKNAAETAESGAVTAKNQSETARDKSQEWAENAEDVPVETGQFSALHHSKKAKSWAEEVEDTEVEPGKYSSLHWAAKSQDAASVIDRSESSIPFWSRFGYQEEDGTFRQLSVKQLIDFIQDVYNESYDPVAVTWAGGSSSSMTTGELDLSPVLVTWAGGASPTMTIS